MTSVQILSINYNKINIVYVDKQASGANDGTSWENAFTSLSEALQVTDSFTEVWVKELIIQVMFALLLSFYLQE